MYHTQKRDSEAGKRNKRKWAERSTVCWTLNNTNTLMYQYYSVLTFKRQTKFEKYSICEETKRHITNSDTMQWLYCKQLQYNEAPLYTISEMVLMTLHVFISITVQIFSYFSWMKRH